MDKELKLGRQHRDLQGAQITVTRDAAGPARLAFSASSENPVDRWFGTEVLSHKPGAMRMDRLDAGAVPLLFNHNWDDPIGMVDKAALDGGRLMVQDSHLFDTARAKEVASMIDGGLRNVSIGYRMHTIEEDKKAETFTATDWELFEISIVTVPADSSVGVGRAEDKEALPVRVIGSPAQPAITEGAIEMPEVTGAPAGAVAAEPKDDRNAVQLEEGRQNSLRNVAKLLDIDERIYRRWITDGTTVEDASTQALTIKSMRQKADPVTYLDAEVKEVRKYSVLRGLRAASKNDWKDAGLEREASEEIAKRIGRAAGEKSFYVPMEVQQRDLTVASNSGGGYLKATDNMSFIELLRNRMVVRAMGATVMSGLVGNVTIPKQTVAATGYWLTDEATAITESQQTFGQLALTPRTVGALTQISRLLMLQSSPSAEQLVMSDLAKVVAIAVDLAALAGTGTEQPTGIIQTGSIGGFTGTSLAAAGLLDAQADVAGANALDGSLGYVTTPTVAGLLMARPELPTSGTTRMWQGNMKNGSIFGFPAMTSNQMPAGDMIFGDWSQLVIGEWGVLELAASESANTADFHKGIHTLRAFYTVDVGVRYAGAFSLATSIT